jgi:peptidoglycan/xylan/chitin deacetylase (PgdA/CDA1 family)
MFARLLPVVFVSSALAMVAGCAAESDEEVFAGDGDVSEDALVAERQLNGSELPDKTISLTFDDGPGRRTTELADYLASNGIQATFFINGSKVPGRQAALETIVARGHLLANHTQNHKQLTSLSPAAVVQEVTQTDAFIAEVQPQGPWVLRAPFGAWNGRVARAINDSPMRKYVGSVFWDEGGALTTNAAADWDCWGKGVSVERCGELYLKEIRSKRRGVVLMHDIHDKTVDMVKQMVPVLKAEGYRFVPIQDVPSVKRAIQAADTGEAPASDNECQSATLGRPVAEDVCVQSRSDQRWYRCVDGEWAASTGPSDAKCKQRFGL